MSPHDLAPPQRDALWALYAPDHDVSRERFDERLGGFDRIALFVDTTGERTVGFTGIRMREIDVPAGRFGTLYFGQTYIDGAFRGKNLIQRTVVRLLFAGRLRSPRTPWYFWSDALTYKPYLIMARNLARFYPHPWRSTPPEVKALIDRLGQIYYGELYDSGSGTVRKPARTLREHVAPIGEEELRDPFIRFYAERNAGHNDGHGLIIACPMSMENLLSYLRRRARRALWGEGR